MKIDFHCHTHHSIDSIIKPKELAAKAKRLGIIPAITDHHSLVAHHELKQVGLHFIPGEEIRTIQGDLIGLYVQEAIPKKILFPEALDRIKEQGGIASLPHMFDRTRHGVMYHQLASKVDMIEVFNARCPIHSYNLAAEHFAIKHKKLAVAGSDSHFLFEFGKTFVELKDLEFEDIHDNPKALLRALKNAHIHGSKAPVFVRGSTLIVKFAKRFFSKM